MIKEIAAVGFLCFSLLLGWVITKSWFDRDSKNLNNTKVEDGM